MQQAKILSMAQTYINGVTNISLINNKANMKRTCNKDDINILARAYACVCEGVCLCVISFQLFAHNWFWGFGVVVVCFVTLTLFSVVKQFCMFRQFTFAVYM